MYPYVLHPKSPDLSSKAAAETSTKCWKRRGSYSTGCKGLPKAHKPQCTSYCMSFPVGLLLMNVRLGLLLVSFPYELSFGALSYNIALLEVSPC